MIELIKKITNLANNLDRKGLTKEADLLDGVVTEISDELYGDEGECGEDLDDEAYFLENLSHMYEDIKQEDDAQDLVDT